MSQRWHNIAKRSFCIRQSFGHNTKMEYEWEDSWLDNTETMCTEAKKRNRLPIFYGTLHPHAESPKKIHTRNMIWGITLQNLIALLAVIYSGICTCRSESVTEAAGKPALCLCLIESKNETQELALGWRNTEHPNAFLIVHADMSDNCEVNA